VVSLPDEAYLVRRYDQLRLDPVALNRIVRPARDRGWSIYTVHTHPGASAPWFSPADDAGDSRLMPALYVQSPDAPHGSMVLTSNRSLAARTFTPAGEVLPTRVTVVGQRLDQITELEGAGATEWFSRQRLALGAWGQARVRALRVAVVGVGGIGSVLVAQLAHLGVGYIVLVDGDLIEASNLSRIIGATIADIGLPKTAVAARYARGLGMGGEVREIPRALDARSAGELVDCDVVFSCVDRHSPRAVLNRLAYDIAVPLIDLGTAFRVEAEGGLVGDAGRVVVAGPGRPCLACWGHLDPRALREEALRPEERDEEVAAGYIQGAREAQPSVIPFNTMVAGAGVIEMLRLVAGFGVESAAVHRLAFSFSEATVKRNRLPGDARCRICGAPAVYGGEELAQASM
jgi:hypothetical protein